MNFELEVRELEREGNINPNTVYNIYVLVENSSAIFKRQITNPVKKSFNQQIEVLRDSNGNEFNFLDKRNNIIDYLVDIGFEYVGLNTFYNYDMNEQQERLVFRRHFKINGEKIIYIDYTV